MSFKFTITRYSKDLFESPQSAFGFIDDWYDLGVQIGVKVKTLSYSLKERDNLQKLIRLGDRVVYDSAPALKRVQNRLTAFLTQLYDFIDTDHLLGYIKGKDPRKIVREECTGHSYLVHFDIKGYYDHIRIHHIVDTLKTFGFSHRGAKLIARYCVVRREIKGKTISTLQQGSPASPILSNLVGYRMFDEALMVWLNDHFSSMPEISFKYMRYSDNVALFLNGEIPIESIQAYKDFVRDHLTQMGFKTHKWVTRPNNHPKQNQKFLGIVLNQIARIEKDKFNRLRATLFNACSKGLSDAAEQYFNSGEAELPTMLESSYTNHAVIKQLMVDKFVQSMNGNIAYIKSINANHALQLKKMLVASQELASNYNFVRLPTGELAPAVFEIIKDYKEADQTLEHFLGALMVAMSEEEKKVIAAQKKEEKLKKKKAPPSSRGFGTSTAFTDSTTGSSTNWTYTTRQG